MMFDNTLTKRLHEARKKGILVSAHRGVGGGNIPFNTLAGFEVALRQGADIIETDVIKSVDGVLYVFHIGQEKNHLNRDINLTEMTSEEINQVRYVNPDNCLTDCRIPTLDEVFEQLKGRCLINLDHGWDGDWFEDMLNAVRRHNMQDQVIIKTPSSIHYLKQMEELGSDLMFMPIISENDTVSIQIEKMKVNYIGAEVVFANDDAPVASKEYIEYQHSKGRLIWVNPILYDSRVPLCGGHTDDISVTGNPDQGWGWLIDRGFDILQTDWPLMLIDYLRSRGLR